MQPTILIESLESVRRRVRVLAVTYGVGLVVTAAICLLLAAVTADYLLNLPAVPRTLLVLAAVATVGFGVYRWLVQPMLARLTLNDVAGRVERTYPQFQDRLRSTVDILAGREVPGSEVMKQRVVSEAARLTQSLDLSRVVVARPVLYSSAGATAAVAVLAGLLVLVGGDFAHLAMARLFTPFAGVAWPKSVEIQIVGTVPDRVTVGQRVDVNVRLSRGDKPSRRTTIFYAYGDGAGHFGPVQQEFMTRGDDGVYHAAVDAHVPDALAGSTAAATTGVIKIWTDSGDGHYDVPLVRVVQRLGIERVEAFITPPPYAAQPVVHVDLTQAPATMTVGSTVRLVATFNKPLDRNRPVTTELLPGAKGQIPPWAATSASAVQASFTAAASTRFHLHGVDADGIANTAAEEFELVVRPDQNPTVMIESPRRNEDVTPQAVVPLQAVAEDDFGIATVTLVVDRLGDKKRWEVPLVRDSAPTAGVRWVRADGGSTAGGGDLVRFRGNYDFDLTKSLAGADLKPGDTLDYFLLAKDNFSLDGQSHPPVSSGHLRLNLISQDELTNQVTAELQTTADQVSTLKRTQADTQRQTTGLARATADKPAMDAADRVAADRLSGQQGTLASQAKSVATKLETVQHRLDENRSTNADLKATAKDVDGLLTSAAEGPMKDAAAEVSQTKDAASPADRQLDFKDAQNGQVQSGETLQKALDRMGNIGSLSRTIENVRDLLAEQQKVSAATADAGKATLGQSVDQMKPGDKAKVDAAAKSQQDLANRTAKALDEMAKDADKLAKSDPSASAAMKQAADTGQQQAVVPNQQKASSSTSQNQQSQAQSAQKNAELGLQMILADLREAERHKLDELNRKLAELQQQVNVLVRRQSGHNLDTVANLGTGVTLDDKVRAALFDQAERDPKAPPPPPDVPTLSAGQEQTERNARDVAKSAEDLPDGAAPADHLTDAADQMERAIVHLRAGELAEAFSPPQTKALDALLAAKRVIDEQKKKSDTDQNNQKKEAIRQAYIAIRVAQLAVNTKTTGIDHDQRNDDGSRHREDAIALAALPGEQGKVVDRTAKLDEALAAVGSVVYTWANQDIVKNMRASKELLGQSDTGPVAHAKQQQVLDELDAMIRDLAIKPETSKFAQNSGGGGGGGSGSPNMPTEAELRLMKDLQVAENTATTAVAKGAAGHKAETLALGGRQGDLRGLLDTLIQKASHGKAKLPPEPDNKEQLPEEKAGPAATPDAAQEKVDDQELTDDLIGAGAKPAPKPAPGVAAKPPAPADDGGDHALAVVGDRMARARQRLAMNDDPGAITQEIQRRILGNLDDLIEQARKKEAQQQNQQPKPGEKGEQMAQAKPDTGVQQQGQQKGPHGERGTSPANAANPGGSAPATPEGADAAKQTEKMWGQPTPRERQAINETATEKTLDKYKNLVDDYYRNMATRNQSTQ